MQHTQGDCNVPGAVSCWVQVAKRVPGMLRVKKRYARISYYLTNNARKSPYSYHSTCASFTTKRAENFKNRLCVEDKLWDAYKVCLVYRNVTRGSPIMQQMMRESVYAATDSTSDSVTTNCAGNIENYCFVLSKGCRRRTRCAGCIEIDVHTTSRRGKLESI